jgi:hypothetical protein
LPNARTPRNSRKEYWVKEESVQGEQVYVVGGPGSPLVKIGRSRNVSRRLADLQRMSPVVLAVLGVFHGGSDLEAALHRRFRHQRAHGEWFDLGNDPLAAVQAAVDSLSDEAAVGEEPRMSSWAMTVTSRRAGPSDVAALGVEPGELILVVAWSGTDESGKQVRRSEVQKAGWEHWFGNEPDYWYPREDGTAYFRHAPQPFQSHRNQAHP